MKRRNLKHLRKLLSIVSRQNEAIHTLGEQVVLLETVLIGRASKAGVRLDPVRLSSSLGTLSMSSTKLWDLVDLVEDKLSGPEKDVSKEDCS